MPYALFWKGKRMKEYSPFKTKDEAETCRGIEMTQMEFAEFTSTELDKWFKVKEVE